MLKAFEELEMWAGGDKAGSRCPQYAAGFMCRCVDCVFQNQTEALELNT